MLLLHEDMISRIRYGYTTNSSSTHSIIFYDGEEELGKYARPQFKHFGWEWFLQKTSAEKNNYFRAYAHEFFKDMELVEKYFPEEFSYESDYENKNTLFIDHQSYYGFPEPYLCGYQTLEDLFLWIKENIILDNRVFILGGNDNCEPDETPLYKFSPECTDGNKKRYSLLKGYNGIINSDYKFKIDPQGFVTFFKFKKDRSSSTTPEYIRTKIKNTKIPRFTYYPDLIDLKITNYCSKECDFCYQNSNKAGKHYEFNEDKFSKFVRRLREIGIFEVAIGGGEPTMHPHFMDIIHTFIKNGIVPCFSTQNLKAFQDEKFLDVIKSCYAAAYSTNSIKKAKKWICMANKRYIPNPTIHYILGLNPIGELRDFIDKLFTEDFYLGINFSVILLSYKNSGRGVKPRYNYDEWTTVINDVLSKRITARRIGVDSFLLKDVCKKLPNVSHILYDDPKYSDGCFSFYCDLVESKYAEHSADPSLLFSCDDPGEAWERIISKYKKLEERNN